MFEVFCKEKLGPLVLRLAVGFVCLSHGYLKITADGGTSWYPGMQAWGQLGIAWGELVAGVAILLGFRCRWGATLLALATTSATLIYWQGWNLFHQPLRSLEFSILFLLASLALIFQGGGELSLDRRSAGGLQSAAGTPRKKAA